MEKVEQVRLPKHPRCPVCKRQLSIDPKWVPAAGYEQNLRNYLHARPDYCRYAICIQTSLEESPR